MIRGEVDDVQYGRTESEMEESRAEGLAEGLTAEMPLRDLTITEKPIRIPISIGGKLVLMGTADNGAMVNAVSKRLYDSQRTLLGESEASGVRLKSVSGKRISSEGTIKIAHELVHDQGNVFAETTFFIIDSEDDWDLLLGKPWLKAVGARIDHRDDLVVINLSDDTTRCWTNEAQIDKSADYNEQDIGVGMLGRSMGPKEHEEEVLRRVKIGNDLTVAQRLKVESLIRANHEAFAIDLSELNACTHTEHHLDITPGSKLTRTAFGKPMSDIQLKAAVKLVDKMIDAGIIEAVEPEVPRCVAPTVMVVKKAKIEEEDATELARLADEALVRAGGRELWGRVLGERKSCPITSTEPPVSVGTRKGGLKASQGPAVSSPRPYRTNGTDAAESTDASARKPEKAETASKPVEFRMCHNFGQINRATPVLSFPPGDLEIMIKRHAGKRYICQADGLGAFFWIPVRKEDQPYLCFFVPTRGYLMYKRTPMGLNGSPGTYYVAGTRTFGHLLNPGNWDRWMDDFFSAHDEFDTLYEDLVQFLDAARKDGYKLSADKMYLFVSEATVGGHVLSREGVSPDPQKIAAIVHWPELTTSHEVLSFVNTAAVFRTFIPRFADIAEPLYELMQIQGTIEKGHKKGAYKKALQNENITSRWTEKHTLAVALLKKALTSWPVLVGPNYDGSPFYLATDASSAGIGCHLYQRDSEGKKRSIAYLSRQTTKTESRAHSSTLELVAVKFGIDKCSKFTYGYPLVVQTDCQAVRDLLRSESAAGPRAAWKEAICAAGIVEFEHVPGVNNEVADALSRNPSGPPEDTTTDVHPDKGIDNSLTIGVNRISVDDEIAILDRFADDDIEDVLRWILQRDVEMIEDELREDVRRRSMRYWIDERNQVKYRVPGRGAVTVLPRKEGPEFAARTHEECGHLGRDLLVNKILSTHIWPGARKDADQSIFDCARCVQFGSTLQKLLLKPVFEYSPFARVAMDYLAMPVGRGGYDNILIAIDVFSRFMMGWIFKGNGTAEKTIKALTEMSQKYLKPRALLLDNDKAFDNEAVRAWCEGSASLCGRTAMEFASPYEHVGLAENSNHLVLERLRRIANLDIDHVPIVTKAPYPKNWPDLLQTSIDALNNRKLKYLGGLSPREVLLGVQADETDESGEAPTVGERLGLLAAARLDATAAFQEEQERRRKCSKSWNEYIPKEGDLVLLFDTSDDRTYSTQAKLRPKWQGPWRVRAVVGRRSVALETIEGIPRKGHVGFRRLKKWIRRKDEMTDEDGHEGEGSEGSGDEEGSGERSED